MLVVLVERLLHGLLGLEVELDGARRARRAADELARHLADRAVGHQRDPADAAVAVLDDRLMALEVESDHEGARAVGRRQRQGLESPSGESKRGVLELGSGGARTVANLPRTCEWPWSVSRVSRHAS